MNRTRAVYVPSVLSANDLSSRVRGTVVLGRFSPTSSGPEHLVARLSDRIAFDTCLAGGLLKFWMGREESYVHLPKALGDWCICLKFLHFFGTL